jgi:hypothetical protein
MKKKTCLLLAFLICVILSTGCSTLQMPGVVTVPAPGLTRLPAPTAQPATAQALIEPVTLTPFPASTQAASATLTLSATPTLTSSITASSTVSPTPSASPRPAATAGPSPTALPSDTAEPGAAPGILPHYSFDISMDYGKTKTLDVQQVIDYPNTSSETLTNIVLAVTPNLVAGVFDLKNIWADETPLTNYSLDGQKLTLTLPFALKSTKSIKLEFEYSLTPPAIVQGDPNVIRPQIFGVTERQVNLTDWYPMVVPYIAGQGWLLHNPWYYGEHLVYPLADFDINLRFKDPVDTPVVAASSKGTPIKDGTHYELKNARDFSFSMGRQFKTASDNVDGVTVTSYFYASNGTAGRAALDATLKALHTYGTLFGPYPHATLAVVQGDFNDGMEFDGLYFLSNAFYNLYDNTEKNYLVMIAAHETSHQWWFGRVANDQALEPWLDEALATYCEKLFYENNYPGSVTWWRGYRIDFYNPSGPIDANVPAYGGFSPYTDAVYRRGALFLGELRAQIGDPAFFAFLKDYSLQMDGRIAVQYDFIRILRQHTQADLTDLLAKYFAHPPKY